mgnify:CR=1 FL=1
MRVFNIQMTSVPDLAENMAFVGRELEKLGRLSGDLVVLPECFAYFGGIDKMNLEIAEKLGDGSLQTQLSSLASKHKCYLVAGSFPIQTESGKRFKPMCMVYSPGGERICEYQKIHLFDVEVADGTKEYRESDSAEPGQNIVCFDTEWGRVGVAICYDLRFPGLFQQLRDAGAELVVLPSAFTQKTGEAHWHLLLQARAIENQMFMAGCNQVGRHENGRETFGHSLVVDPWGTILVDGEQQTGAIGTELNKKQLLKIRRQMPVAMHNRFSSRFDALIE